MNCLNCLKKIHVSTWHRKFIHHRSFASVGLTVTSPIISPPVLRKFNVRNFSFASYVQIFSNSTPVLGLQRLLIEVHDYSGLPWWAVICLTTLSIRTVLTFPLTVHQHQVSARLKNVHAELAKLAPELSKEVTAAARMNNWDLKMTRLVYKKNMRRFYKEFIVRDNCHPFKGMALIFVQVPLWICFSAALRNLTFMMPDYDSAAQRVVDELKCGGLLWFPDLTVADPIFIPILIGALNLTLIEMHNTKNLSGRSLLAKVLINATRALTVSVCIAASVCPSSMSFYWLCSSLCGLGQTVLLITPKVRHFLRIPNVADDSATPFKDMLRDFKSKFLGNKNK